MTTYTLPPLKKKHTSGRGGGGSCAEGGEPNKGSCPLSYFLYFRLTALQFRGELLVVAPHGALDGLVLYEALQCLLP